MVHAKAPPAPPVRAGIRHPFDQQSSLGARGRVYQPVSGGATENVDLLRGCRITCRASLAVYLGVRDAFEWALRESVPWGITSSLKLARRLGALWDHGWFYKTDSGSIGRSLDRFPFPRPYGAAWKWNLRSSAWNSVELVWKISWRPSRRRCLDLG